MERQPLRPRTPKSPLVRFAAAATALASIAACGDEVKSAYDRCMDSVTANHILDYEEQAQCDCEGEAGSGPNDNPDELAKIDFTDVTYVINGQTLELTWNVPEFANCYMGSQVTVWGNLLYANGDIKYRQMEPKEPIEINRTGAYTWSYRIPRGVVAVQDIGFEVALPTGENYDVEGMVHSSHSTGLTGE